MTPTVIILSLEDATERRAPLIKAFQAHGMPYKIWHAIDGREGLPPEYESLIDRPAARRNRGRDMGNAEFACALSHHFIYRDILKRGLEMAVILEDDAIVDERFFSFLKSLQTPSCDLLLLDHMQAVVQRTGRMTLENGMVAHRCAVAPILTTGYVITRRGAQKLVDRSLPIVRTADWPTDLKKMQAYALAPRLVDHSDQRSGPSDIRPERERFEELFWRPRTARRFLRLSYWRKTYHKRLGKWIS